MHSRITDYGHGVSVEPSPAISSLYETINKMSKDHRSPAWDYVLINVATLCRNNITKELNEKDVIMEGGLDGVALKGALRNYWNHNPKTPKHTEIIEYIPDYECLPLLYRRPETKSSQQLKSISKYLKEFLLKDSPTGIKKETENTTVMVAGSSKSYPYQDILKYIHKSRDTKDQIKSFFGLNNLRIAMLSHCALDWHIGFYVKEFHLLESFTGNIKGMTNLGEKLFKEPFIPFNKATHILFGDSTHVKALAQRKNKQLILDAAKKARWYAKSESGIIDDICKTLVVPKSIITQAKF